MSTRAQERAYVKATEHVREAAVALGLDFDTLTPAFAQAVGAQDGPPGRIFVAAKWWLPSGLPSAPAFDTLIMHWLRQGYRVLGDGRDDALPYVWAEDPSDGYRLGLEGNVAERLVLGASSPLFWPDGGP